jgi:hypothetical protein
VSPSPTAVRSSPAQRLGIGVAVTAATVGALAVPAEARPIVRGTTDREISDVLNDFCDVPGLTLDHRIVVTGRFQIHSRKPGSPPYYLERSKSTETFTNEAGEQVRVETGVLDKDLKVTDNGDGTLTALALATGSAKVYNSAGKVIARDPGQVRFELLIDHGGTPADPSDDEEIAFLGVVKGSTGRSDDFCAAIVQELG